MRRLEVLHLLGTAAAEGTSMARSVKTLASELDPARFRLHVWFLGEDGPLREEMEAVKLETRVFQWKRGARDPLGALRFRSALVGRGFDIVHQHHGARSVRWLIRRASGAALVVHLHGAVTSPGIALAGADGVIACSRWVAKQVDQACEVIYPGVPGGQPRPIGPGEPPVIGMASRLVAEKGLFEMLVAMKQLVEQGSPVQLEIAGDGPLRDDVTRQIGELGLQDRVRLLGWQADLEPVFQRWSLFAMPSVNEGFGLAVLEAMAQGLPVVGLRSGGLPELILDGETGLLSDVAESGGLLRNVRSLLENTELRSRLGMAGQARVTQHFSPGGMALRTAAVYETLLGIAPGGGQREGT